MARPTSVSQETSLDRNARRFNALMTFILRSPLHGLLSWRLILITVFERKTGRSSTIPASYVKDGDTLLVTGGGEWQKNLRQGMVVRVRWRGKDRPVRCEVIGEANELTHLLEIMLAANPALGAFIGIGRTPDGSPDLDDLERARWQGLVVIQLYLDEKSYLNS